MHECAINAPNGTATKATWHIGRKMNGYMTPLMVLNIFPWDIDMAKKVSPRAICCLSTILLTATAAIIFLVNVGHQGP